MNTHKTLGSNKQHSDRECLYKTIVTMTGKGARLQEWTPVFFCKYPGIINVRIFTEEQHNHDGTGLSQVVLNAIHNLVPPSGLCPDFISLSAILNNQIHRFHRTMNPDDFDKLNVRR